MIRYTTPILPLEVEGIDLTENQDVYVTLKQGRITLTKKNSDLTISYDSEKELSTITFSLTQTESAAFNIDKAVDIQVNYINSSQVRDATNIANIPVMRNLLDEEISYGN